VIDWQSGGWTGSINRLVRKELRAHQIENAAIRKSRYPLLEILLKKFFLADKFVNFIGIYLIIAILIVTADVLCEMFLSKSLPAWARAQLSTDFDTHIKDITGYMIAVQVGALGIVSIAIALATLLSQKQRSSTDIKIYYYESNIFGISASSVALLFILSIQLFWPHQSLLFFLNSGTKIQLSKISFVSIHLFWLLFNLAGTAHFIATTFGFVQRSSRAKLRERYTANVVFPADFNARLRPVIYQSGAQDLISEDDHGEDDEPCIYFGSLFALSPPYETEARLNSAHQLILVDVKMTIVRWVLRRWIARCKNTRGASSGEAGFAGLSPKKPTLSFTPDIDVPISGSTDWCRRRGGVPLTRLERIALRLAFCFRRAKVET